MWADMCHRGVPLPELDLPLASRDRFSFPNVPLKPFVIMIVYLEHVKGIYGVKLDQSLVEDIISRYVSCRIKMFHLEKSWKRFRTEYGDDKEKKGAGGFKY